MSSKTLGTILVLILLAGVLWYFEKGNSGVHESASNTSGPIFTVATSTGETYLLVTADGKVGVGTLKPNATLDVAGPIRMSGSGTEECTAGITGEILYNPNAHHFFGCDGVKWRQLDTP